MSKIIRNFKIDYSLDWTYGIDIEDLRKDLDELEKLGATHIEIEPYVSYDCPGVSIDAYANRLETDDEYNERVRIEKFRKKEIEDRELEQLMKLQEKYNLSNKH